MTIYERVTSIVSSIEQEVETFKSIVENNFEHEKDFSFSPVIVFFSDVDTRRVVVSVSNDGNQQDVFRRISEAFNLYPLLESHAAIIATVSTTTYEHQTNNVLNLFVVNYNYAWSIIVPFKNIDNNIHWLNDDIIVSPVDEIEVDDSYLDLLSMFYLYTHISNIPFTLEELLSYLSTRGAAVAFIDSDTPKFFDFSQNNFLQNSNVQ